MAEKSGIWQAPWTFNPLSGAPPGNTNAYLTSVVYPTTSGVGHTESFSYGYNDGQLTQSTDENKQETQYEYNDKWSRPTEASYPDGGQTGEAYNDSPYSTTTPSPSVTTTKAITSSTNLVTGSSCRRNGASCPKPAHDRS